MDIDPKEYVSRLKTQQGSIIAAINNVDKSAARHLQIQIKTYNALKPYIKIFQDEVLALFEWQKKPFWDFVAGRYSLDDEALKVIEFLQVYLKDIKIQMFDFLERHPADMGDLNPKEFYCDFVVFSKEVIAFLNEEIKYLLPLLENISTC